MTFLYIVKIYRLNWPPVQGYFSCRQINFLLPTPSAPTATLKVWSHNPSSPQKLL